MPAFGPAAINHAGVAVELLKKLIDACGISGREERVREILMEEIKGAVDDCRVDRMGSLIAHKKGKKPRVMLSAHMDEIGLMIQGIGRDGVIRCSAVGYIEPMVLVGQKVHIQTAKGQIHGVITTREVSADNELRHLPKMQNLFADTGLAKKQLLKLGVEIGSYLPLEQEPVELGSKDIISGKALDDRIGCYILVELAKRLKNADCEIFYVFTVEEETALAGGKTSAYLIEPDWAVAVDTTSANDFSENATKRMGKGPCITVKDQEMIANRCVNGWLQEVAKKKKIPVQTEVTDIGTTDAKAIAVSRGGIPCGILRIPIRNMHTTVGIAHMGDIEAAIKILESLLKKAPKFPNS